MTDASIIPKHKGVLSKKYHIQRKNTYAAKYRLKRRTNEVLKAIKTHIIKDQLALLDIGTADGLMLNNLANELSPRISVGIDFSLELLKFADANQSFFVQSDASKLPFKDNFFDVVVACAVIEHVPNAGAMINECNRVLKRGGLCIITTPDPFFENIATMIGHLNNDDHNETFNLSKLKFLFGNQQLAVFVAEKFMISPIGIPCELLIEKIMKCVGLERLLLNQIIVGIKQ
jgi:ubiquinone/menaquinone biosynthesis C-methylase UbiE